jgi:hypothetical protein
MCTLMLYQFRDVSTFQSAGRKQEKKYPETYSVRFDFFVSPPTIHEVEKLELKNIKRQKKT